MMSVSEYASDVGLSVKEILNLCQKLNISVTTEKDELSEEDIILLDNELANEEVKEELPEDLPKTGSTQYGFIISVLAVLGCSYIVLKNSKKQE